MCDNLCFTVIGISDVSKPRLTEDSMRIIKSAKFFSGGRRHRELVADILPKDNIWIDIVVPLDNVYDRYREVNEHIVVFASGDPLFFGYTTTLMRVFPNKVKHTTPTFNSLQMLCHAVTLPYHDMRVVSLTGRPWLDFDRAVIERANKIGVLTDKKNTPKVIAQRLIDYGYDYYSMYIGVRLGGDRQEVYKLPLDKVVDIDFEHPNCLVLVANKEIDKSQRLGINELEFFPLNGRVNMITKMPIRLLSLSMMDLHKCSVMWDVGFCTGSVSIESKLQFPHLDIHSFEIREEGDELMKTNSRRFGAMGINYYICDFLENKIENIPNPDAVFIGGHGGKLIEFIEKINKYLKHNGSIVFNSVKTETLNSFEQACREYNLDIVDRMHIALDEHNPITILKAVRR